MKTDDVNPMNELERLFENRNRSINRVIDLKNKIASLGGQIDSANFDLKTVETELANTETLIKEYAKKL